MNVRRVLAVSLVANLALGAAVGAVILKKVLAAPRRVDDSYARSRAGHFAELAARRAAGGGPDVVLLGDSLVDRAEWHELLGQPAANRGIAGDRIADLERRLDPALAGEPRTVFLTIGVNDLLSGRDPDAVATDHARLLAAVRARAPGARLIVTSLLPVNDALVARSGEQLVMATIAETNRRLASAAAAAGAEWLELSPHLAGPDGQLLARYTTDGLHLTAEGYRAWSSALAPYLSAR